MDEVIDDVPLGRLRTSGFQVLQRARPLSSPSAANSVSGCLIDPTVDESPPNSYESFTYERKMLAHSRGSTADTIYIPTGLTCILTMRLPRYYRQYRYRVTLYVTPISQSTYILQCSDTVVWATGRASGLFNSWKFTLGGLGLNWSMTEVKLAF